tara:strand:- start:2999 stop:4042 length:1044 start_codon:yes stop_codon:yes gene_type:complete
MAFLDNSGDILLDAVLTDVGRERLSEGTFSISHFGLGDDEINYGTYNSNHPSGSAYYDLEIMQTPILEAWSTTNANVNYGLLTIHDYTLEYLPVLELNENTTMSVQLARLNGAYYLAANSETFSQLTSTSADGGEALDGNVLRAGDKAVPSKILWESGLDTLAVGGTAANRSSLLVGKDLLDRGYSVEADSDIFTRLGGFGARGATSALYFRNDSVGNFEYDLILTWRNAAGSSSNLDGYDKYSFGAVDNLILSENDSSVDPLTLSVIKGPRGSIGMLAFEIDVDLRSNTSRDRRYVTKGKTAVAATTLFGSSTGKTYDYIDTMVYVQGDNSGATLQIPIRLIRMVS